MKIIFDNDDTLTDFTSWINKKAVPYFEKKYGMHVVYDDKIELEDKMDMVNFFMNKENLSKEEAKLKVKKCINKFWQGINFIDFTLCNRFRKGALSYINEQLKNGHDIEIHSSRDKTTENSAIGKIARLFTIIQYRINGIMLPKEKIFFHKNDDAKIAHIIASKAKLVIDDKPYIINELNKNNIKTICFEGNHNKEINDDIKINSFDKNKIRKKTIELFGLKNISYYERASHSKKFFYKLSKIGYPVVKTYFKPIILNKQNMKDFNQESAIFAPNHRSTLDPFIVLLTYNKPIHFAALKRFFDGEDSIFNNSKNKALCKLTSTLLKKLEHFPIDRKSDNENANNKESILDMKGFLETNNLIGIFPEGTTLKDKTKNFGEFKVTFLQLAKETNSYVQPITLLWVKNDNIKNKVIINIGESFKIDEDMSIVDALNKYISIQEQSIEENKQKLEEIKQKTLKKSKNII